VSDQPTPPVAAGTDPNSAARAQLLQRIAASTGMERVALLQQYLAALPRPAVARCPFTDVVVHHSVDTAGLDGPWWDYGWPQRPVETLPPTFFAFTGALRLGSPLPDLERLAKPGPEAPFVVPRLLNTPGIRAVISSVPVGGWPGWTVTYFTQQAPAIERFNDWGAPRYWLDGGLGVEWDSMTEDAEQLDFELAPWIERGGLLWIAPGDGDARLQSTPAGCPYLGLPGRRTFLRVQSGNAWEPSPPATPVTS